MTVGRFLSASSGRWQIAPPWQCTEPIGDTYQLPNGSASLSGVLLRLAASAPSCIGFFSIFSPPEPPNGSSSSAGFFSAAGFFSCGLLLGGAGFFRGLVGGLCRGGKGVVLRPCAASAPFLPAGFAAAPFLAAARSLPARQTDCPIRPWRHRPRDRRRNFRQRDALFAHDPLLFAFHRFVARLADFLLLLEGGHAGVDAIFLQLTRAEPCTRSNALPTL